MTKAGKHTKPIQIEILGPGNAVSQMTAQVLDAAIRDLGLLPDRDVHLDLIRDSSEIAASGVFWTPAVRVNGDLKCTGRVPSLKEVEGWLTKPPAQSSAQPPPKG